jgi:hypothetical protein
VTLRPPPVPHLVTGGVTRDNARSVTLHFQGRQALSLRSEQVQRVHAGEDSARVHAGQAPWYDAPWYPMLAGTTPQSAMAPGNKSVWDPASGQRKKYGWAFGPMYLYAEFVDVKINGKSCNRYEGCGPGIK